jgi:RNA recognition motif-containing protein
MYSKESTSLMVKFVNSEYLNPEVDDTILLDIFSKFAQVRDIRLIRDKYQPEKYRNFVFVEYFTIEDAVKVINAVKKDPMKINDERVYITFSKTKKDEIIAMGNDGFTSVPDTSLQFDPKIHKTVLEDEEKYLKPNEILKSDQLLPTTIVGEPEPKTKEQIEKEKAETEFK